MAMPRVRFDGQHLFEDMAAKGWELRELAAHADVSLRTAYRFVTGELQTISVAQKLAAALGQTPERYLVRTLEPTATPVQ